MTIHESASIRTSPAPSVGVAIEATSGDVTIDRLILRTTYPMAISGTNVTIGVLQDGSVRRSSINLQSIPIAIDAIDEIHIDNLRLRSPSDVHIETDGTVLDILNSDLVGTTALMPTFYVTANGAGSTCDLSGTEVTKASLVTDCNTVIGA